MDTDSRTRRRSIHGPIPSKCLRQLAQRRGWHERTEHPRAAGLWSEGRPPSSDKWSLAVGLRVSQVYTTERIGRGRQLLRRLRALAGRVVRDRRRQKPLSGAVVASCATTPSSRASRREVPTVTGRVLPALLLAIITLFGGAATASAGAPPLGGPAYSASQYYASVSRGTCSRDSQTAYAYMQESGWSGTEWMRIDAYFQYRYRGDWYTTKHIYHYSRYYFSDDGASHELDWDKRFNYRGQRLRPRHPDPLLVPLADTRRRHPVPAHPEQSDLLRLARSANPLPGRIRIRDSTTAAHRASQTDLDGRRCLVCP